MRSFLEFLQLNQIENNHALPVVHTTRSFRLRQIIEDGAIEPQSCDVFIGEKLNYFFVGRPAYKYDIEAGSDYWMFPTAFIFDLKGLKRKRTYPFDSGGFKRGRMPQFVREMEMSYFDVPSLADAPERIIGAFFGTAEAYMNFKGRTDQDFYGAFELSPLDAELHALHRLSVEGKNPAFEDRQFTIEIQSEEPIRLDSSLIAIVAPIVYLDDAEFVKYFDDLGVEILSYDIHPIEPKLHFYAIYDRIKTFYRQEGWI